MKRILCIAGLLGLAACGPQTGQEGAVDDGIRTVDENGALRDSSGFVPSPGVDSAMGDHRVDTERRDSSTFNP